MDKLFALKDENRYVRRWGPDGNAQDLCDEDYAVINFRGEEVFRTPSRIDAERWIRAATARFFSESAQTRRKSLAESQLCAK